MNQKKQLTLSAKRWLDLEEEIQALRIQIREKQSLRKEVTTELQTLMHDLQITDLTLQSGGAIRQKVSKTVAPLTRDHIQQVLTRELKNEGWAKEVTAKIFDQRIRIERDVLRRVKR